MFACTLPDDSEKTLDYFCELECRLFDGLEIPYRVVDTASGDLGGPAYRKFDLEAWMPGRGQSGEYGEVTSASDCTDYQARRLNVRHPPTRPKGTRFAPPPKGTPDAPTRGLIVILENYQRSDGRVDVPAVLRPYLGKEVIGA